VGWNNPLEYPFTVFSIRENGSPESGVYALFNGETWIYLGDADNIQQRLLVHLSPDSPHFIAEPATMFSYEKCAPEGRAARLKELIEEFHPLLNRPG
jgi:predicted GIY-YIG superfamily endonuclease